MSFVTLKDVAPVIRTLTGLPKQVKFATALALNRTGQSIQNYTTERLLPGKLTLRQKGRGWYAPGQKLGFNLKPRASRENLSAIVGSGANWLTYLEHPATKRVAQGRLAIPTTFWKKREEILKREKKPRALLRAAARARRGGDRAGKLVASAIGRLANKPFLYEGERMPPGIYVRTTREAFPIRGLFQFRGKARVETNLQYEDKGALVASSVFHPHFRAAFLKAVAHAR
jgi:hypothetical protein